jgi:mRNA interferase MazF
MQKDFENWNIKKQQLDGRTTCPTFKEREIWWCSIGTNIGYEIGGKGETFSRPVLIVRKFSNHSFWGVPLTSKHKNNPYYYSVNFNNGCDMDNKKSYAIISQLSFYDVKRLGKQISTLTDEQFFNIKNAMRELV